MNKRIALLRGINVGGKRKIIMKDLSQLFLKMGFTAIQTYIQSGNVIFNSASEINNIELAGIIEKSIFNTYGFQVPVIVLNTEELHAAITENPFYKAKDCDIERLHLTFLKEIADKEKLEKIVTLNFAPDKFEIKNKNAFIFCSGKYHQSKLSNSFFESKLKVQASTRNWKTVLKLAELAN